MTTLVEELSARARALPDEDRARLAEELLASLDHAADDGANAESAWERAIHHRIEQIVAGTADLIPAEDVHAKVCRLVRR